MLAPNDPYHTLANHVERLCSQLAESDELALDASLDSWVIELRLNVRVQDSLTSLIDYDDTCDILDRCSGRDCLHSEA